LNGKLTNSVAALDLGGGSIQITFIPTNSKQIVKELPEFITEYSIMNEKVNLYSHRYIKIKPVFYYVNQLKKYTLVI